MAGHQSFVSAQNEYSLLARGEEAEVLPAVRQFGLGFLPYFPLYNGILTGKYTNGAGPADARVTKLKPQLLDTVNWDVMERYQELCDDRGITMIQATLGWLLAQPNLTSVIAGATAPEQIVQNVEAATAWVPSNEDLDEIDALFP